MNTSAIITMVLTQVIVICFTVYFFFKVMNTPNKDEGDFPPGP
ncbi:MAG: hypothetical protein R2830_17265 [Saprospiraceae bacterium]